MSYANTAIILAALIAAVGSILVVYFNTKKEQTLQYNQIMEEKYRYMLIMMTCVLDFERRKYFQLNEMVPAESSNEYLARLKEYYYHGLLYCPDSITLAIKQFITQPSRESYILVANNMREFLWKKKTKLSLGDITLIN